MTLSKIIEQLKAADQNKNGMFELGEDVMCALVDLLERRERDKQEPVRYMNRFTGACFTLEQQPDAATDTAVYVPLYAETLGATISNSADIAIDEKDQVTAPVLPVVRLPPEFISPEHGPVVQLEKLMAALAIHGIKYERRFRGSDQSFGNSEQLEPVSQPYTLPEDTKRLDWLDAQNKRLNEYHGTSYGWKFDANFQRNAMSLNDSNYPVMNVRQAIDEAMRAAPQEPTK